MTSLQNYERKDEDQEEEVSQEDGWANDFESTHIPDSSDGRDPASEISKPKLSQATMMMEEAEYRPESPTRSSGDGISLDSLPPLPIPRYETIRRETIGGASLVLLLIATFVGLTQGVALTAIRTVPPDTTAHVTILALIYGEALLAVSCLFGILFVDPGFIQRSPETCYPLPESVEVWVRSRLQQQDERSSCPAQHNGIVEGNDDDHKETASTTTGIVAPPTELYIADTISGTGRVYCTRCLVWRQPGIDHYHCATCQRCCAYYDHHCPVFGRCIAGDKRLQSLHLVQRGGNYKFFVTIIVVGVVGYVTTAVSLIYALALRYGVKWVVPIGLVVMLWMGTAFANRSPNRVCSTCRFLIVELVECIGICTQKCLGQR